ncbi:MAG: hypothetical protein JWR50_2279 [Mucilaginibacter sp.]|nr:hypothetical protein [Mucilaginibacter sp.]
MSANNYSILGSERAIPVYQVQYIAKITDRIYRHTNTVNFF